VKNWEIQVVVFMIMLTRSSERISNPMRCTGLRTPKWLLHTALPIIKVEQGAHSPYKLSKSIAKANFFEIFFRYEVEF